MATVIGVVNQKGGVGKTTIAVNLACWLSDRGHRVAVIDADGQGASTTWLQRAAPQMKVVPVQAAEHVAKAIELLRPHFDVIVCDGPGGLQNRSNQAIIAASDRLIVPTGPGGKELKGTVQTTAVIGRIAAKDRKGDHFAWGVLNKLRQGTNQAKRARTSMALLGLEPAKTPVTLRDVHDTAYCLGTVVERMKDDSAAKDVAAQLTQLFTEVLPNELTQPRTTGHVEAAVRGDDGAPGRGAGAGGDEVAVAAA